VLLAPAAGSLPALAQAGVPSLTAGEIAAFDPAIRPRVVAASERATREATADAVGELGIVLHAFDRFARAAACYRAAGERAPGAFEWAYLHGVALAATGDVEGAAGAFERARALRPSDVPVRIRLADLRLEQGRIEAAAELYEAVLDQRPASAAAHYGLARSLAGRDADAARMHFERAVDLAPGFAAAHFALAAIYRRQGAVARAEAAIERYRQARGGQAPMDDPLADRVAAARGGPFEDLARGRQLLVEGQPASAVELLTRAVAARRDLVQAHVNLVAAYAALGEPGKSEAAYQAAVALAPELPEAHYNLGLLRLAQGRSAEAAAAFTRAIEGNPSYAAAHNNLGYVLSAEGRAAEAESHLREALAADPDHRDAHFNLARLLLGRREGELAVTHFRRAAAVEDEKTPLYLYYLADAQARLGRYAEAEQSALGARQRAAARGQTELVARIDEDLARLRARVGPKS
jgi:tetratricopeptide (TPR) repeat protein